MTFDKARKAIQDGVVPIYAIGLTQALREMMKTFAKETGGMSFFPQFYGEFQGMFQAISQSLRN